MKRNLLFLGLLLALFACNNAPKPVTNEQPQAQDNPVTVSEAIRLMTDSIAADSLNARLYRNRAQAYLANEQVGAAMIDLNKALKLQRLPENGQEV